MGRTRGTWTSPSLDLSSLGRPDHDRRSSHWPREKPARPARAAFQGGFDASFSGGRHFDTRAKKSRKHALSRARTAQVEPVVLTHAFFNTLLGASRALRAREVLGDPCSTTPTSRGRHRTCQIPLSRVVRRYDESPASLLTESGDRSTREPHCRNTPHLRCRHECPYLFPSTMSAASLCSSASLRWCSACHCWFAF